MPRGDSAETRAVYGFVKPSRNFWLEVRLLPGTPHHERRNPRIVSPRPTGETPGKSDRRDRPAETLGAAFARIAAMRREYGLKGGDSLLEAIDGRPAFPWDWEGRGAS